MNANQRVAAIAAATLLALPALAQATAPRAGTAPASTATSSGGSVSGAVPPGVTGVNDPKRYDPRNTHGRPECADTATPAARRAANCDPLPAARNPGSSTVPGFGAAGAVTGNANTGVGQNTSSVVGNTTSSPAGAGAAAAGQRPQ